ncbi:MAG: MobF family relaxase [Acidimicrobiales bacterium]
MLTIKSADGARGADGAMKLAQYYIDYAAATETPGRWYGSTAVEALGLEVGAVADPDVFLRLVDGVGPDGSVLHKPPSVPFFDLTLSLPKSLSVLAYTHPDEATRQAIKDVLEDSVQRMTAWLEDEMIRSRRGHAGRDGVVDAKLVGLGFRHATNRNDQPHAHVHLLVANVCLGADGRWRALDSAALFGSRQAGSVVKAASQVHDAIVRDLCRERGLLTVEWTQADDAGLREVAGMDRGTIDHFSRDLGIPAGESFQARQVAAYRSRSAKSEIGPDDLVAGWRADLAARRWTPARLAKLTARRQRRWTAPDPAKILAELTTRRATFSRIELEGALALAAPAGASAATIRGWADTVLASRGVVPVVSPQPRTEGVAYDPTPARWSTPAALAREESMIDLAMTCRRHGGQAIPAGVLDAGIEAAGLDDEQADAVRWAASPGLVRCIEAEAGTGKTHSMRALVDAAKQAGVPVLGLSISGQAVVELAEGAGCEAHTIAAWIHPGGRWAGTLQPGQLVIVDEASMVPTAELAQLVRAAHEAGGHVVLVGDREQLGAVEAGGGFAGLVDRLGAARLVTGRRLADDRAQEVAQMVRQGRAAEAVGQLARLGHLVVAADDEAATTALLADWWQARLAGSQTAILAYRRADVARLNAAARQLVADAGGLHGAVVELPSSTKGKGLPARSIQAGDEIVCLRKQRGRSGTVVNGTRGTVVGVSRGTVSIVDRRGNLHRLSQSWCTDWLDLGYATTDHKSQGSTIGKAAAARTGGPIRPEDVGEVFIFGGESMSRQAAYVALTRGTDRTRIYSSASLLADDDWHDTDRDPVELMTRSWAKTEAQDLGITEAERARRVVEMAAAEGRVSMETRYGDLAQVARIGRADPVDVLAEMAAADEALRTEGADEGEIELAAARLARVEKMVDSWRDEPPNLVAIRAEADVLADALAMQRRAAILDAVAEQPAWMTDILGPVPVDPTRTHLWAEAAGDLLDAEHWTVQARLASQSTTVQGMAEPDVVRGQLAAAVQSGDLRQLDEILTTEQADAAVAALIDGAEVEFGDQLAMAPVVRRLAMAGAAAGIEIDDEARREALGRSPDGDLSVGWTAARLRVAMARKVPADAPAAAQLAVLPGVTYPATRAAIEAGLLRRELAKPVPAGSDGGEIARDITPPPAPPTARRKAGLPGLGGDGMGPTPPPPVQSGPVLGLGL